MCQICRTPPPQGYVAISDRNRQGCLNGKSCCQLCPKCSLSCALHVILITTATFCTVTAFIAPGYLLGIKVGGAVVAGVGEVCNCYWTKKFRAVGAEI